MAWWVSALRLRPGCSAAPQMSSGEPTAAGHWLLNLLQRRGAAHTFCSCRADVITAADSHRPRRHRPRPRRRRPRRRRHRSITSCSFRWMPQRCGHRARDAHPSNYHTARLSCGGSVSAQQEVSPQWQGRGRVAVSSDDSVILFTFRALMSRLVRIPCFRFRSELYSDTTHQS